MLHVLISCSFYSHSLNLKTRKLGVFRKPTRPSLPLKKEFFLPLRLSCKESSTFSPSPSSSGSGDVTALRCSEPLRYKVGGASKPCAILCGMGPPCYNLLLPCCYLSKAGLLLAPYEAVHNAAIIDAKPKGGFPSISQRLLIQVE